MIVPIQIFLGHLVLKAPCQTNFPHGGFERRQRLPKITSKAISHFFPWASHVCLWAFFIEVSSLFFRSVSLNKPQWFIWYLRFKLQTNGINYEISDDQSCSLENVVKTGRNSVEISLIICVISTHLSWLPLSTPSHCFNGLVTFPLMHELFVRPPLS